MDEALVLAIEVKEFSEPFDIMQRYEDHPSVYGIERAEEATIAGEPALVGPDGALVQVGCPARGEEAVLDVNVRYQGTWEDPVVGQRDVVAFTEDLVGSLLDHFSCADAA
ncbi:hypothetical protein [Streptomyces sp. B6B3]|uniref:hypothetical protein n=1 Tax=Streptomyces sp. B6B3 TaxID=3153570 RepID=UPI00325E9EA6